MLKVVCLVEHSYIRRRSVDTNLFEIRFCRFIRQTSVCIKRVFQIEIPRFMRGLCKPTKSVQ